MISYRPGTWFGIVGEHATVLLPPSEKARAGSLWVLIDDGAGFDPLSVSRPDAFGLIGMRERIVQLGGSLTVEGRPGAGVTLSAAFRLPVDIRTAAANAER